MIAHAPILSSVSRSSAQRSFCAIVPFDMIAAAVSPTDTPIAVTMPGEHLHSSMIGSSVNPAAATAAARVSPARARSLRRFFSASMRRCRSESRAICVHAERRVELAQQVVRRQVAVLELLAVRADLVVDELPHRVADHLQLFGPFVHGPHRIGRRQVDRHSVRQTPSSLHPPVAAGFQPAKHAPSIMNPCTTSTTRSRCTDRTQLTVARNLPVPFAAAVAGGGRRSPVRRSPSSAAGNASHGAVRSQ